jgi:4-hydroxy-3-polyprenylbenzoate decarboxylase
MERQYIPQSITQSSSSRRLIVGITGASGAVLGIRLLEVLRPTPIETHLVLSDSARLTIVQETDRSLDDVQSLADKNYDFHNIAAAIASGSFSSMGMVIIPCSIKTLSAVANSYTDDLISRAADVTLKEGRPLVLVVRETPYHPGHLRLMSEVAAAGAVIFPPIPAFYLRPRSVDEIVDNTVGRILARLGVENDLYQEWQGQSDG